MALSHWGLCEGSEGLWVSFRKVRPLLGKSAPTLSVSPPPPPPTLPHFRVHPFKELSTAFRTPLMPLPSSSPSSSSSSSTTPFPSPPFPSPPFPSLPPLLRFLRSPPLPPLHSSSVEVFKVTWGTPLGVHQFRFFFLGHSPPVSFWGTPLGVQQFRFFLGSLLSLPF